MAPKHAEKGHEDALNEESKAALHESKRLQDLAYKGVRYPLCVAHPHVGHLSSRMTCEGVMCNDARADAFRDSAHVHRGDDPQQG